MAYTKMYEKNGHHVLLVRNAEGKYKQVFKHKLIGPVKRERAKYQDDSIDTEAKLAKKSFIDLYEEFAAYKLEEANDAAHGVKYKSVIVYTLWFNKYIKPYFPNNKNGSSVLLTQVSPHLHAIPFFKKIRNDAGATWKTADNVVKSIYTALNYAVECQYIRHTNGFEKFSPRKSSALKSRDQSLMQTKKTPMISLNEAVSLIKHFIKPCQEHKNIKDLQKLAVVSTFIFTGMRMSELRGLRWEYINFETQKWEIAKTVVGSEVYDATKADGSPRVNKFHPEHLKVMKAWKKALSLHFTPRKCPLVFPSLRNQGSIIPICDRTVNDWLKFAYHDLGFAVIETVKNKSGDSKLYTRTVSSKFGNNPSRIFRHFASTSLLDNQNKFPVLTDNVVKGYIGHKDIEMTKYYANHNDLNTSKEHEEKIQEALKGSIPISFEEDLIGGVE